MHDPRAIRVHHLNCGTMQAAGNPPGVSHCLLLEHTGRGGGLALIDTGVGLLDVRDPDGRLGRALVHAVGWKLLDNETAFRQIERLDLRPSDVRDVILTHGDPDHTGGLADFRDATVHVGAEERAALGTGHWRYLPAHFAHGPRWKTYANDSRTTDWFGFEARPVELSLPLDVLLVPLPGHTLGHCGVAIRFGDGWLLHAGDAYYLRGELAPDGDNHPISALAVARADDDPARRATLARLRQLLADHEDEVQMFGYHDPGELKFDRS